MIYEKYPVNLLAYCYAFKFIHQNDEIIHVIQMV